MQLQTEEKTGRVERASFPHPLIHSQSCCMASTQPNEEFHFCLQSGWQGLDHLFTAFPRPLPGSQIKKWSNLVRNECPVGWDALHVVV